MTACGRSTDGQDSILEPLCFPEQPADGPSAPSLQSPSSELLVCLFCPESVPLQQKDGLLKHLLLEHKLVIADVKLIADLPKYMLYWRGRFLEQPVTDFCSVIKTNSTGPVEKQEDYCLLCDVLPEDRILRERLQQKRLEEVLEQQQKERDDGSFHRLCMFCSEEFSGNRSSLLNHMAREHSFSIGLPDNIVYCDQFLDTLQNKLDNLQCLYCEKTFRDKTTLKDHMRKKAHRRINASNREYDRFYVINYLELGKSWEEVQSEDDRELVEDEDDDWSDWQAHPVSAVCLFCDHQSETMEQIYSHLKDAHGFDLHKLRPTSVSKSTNTEIKPGLLWQPKSYISYKHPEHRESIINIINLSDLRFYQQVKLVTSSAARSTRAAATAVRRSSPPETPSCITSWLKVT
uniref:Zinc finger protein 277 n=1 Tax=Labrus bergylta TaxID=56723 RepID=A0A3Q3EKP6_9LABR